MAGSNEARDAAAKADEKLGDYRKAFATWASDPSPENEAKRDQARQDSEVAHTEANEANARARGDA